MPTPPTISISQAKRYVEYKGGRLPGESLGDAVQRLEEVRLRKGFKCHECECHTYAPCVGCIDCTICNKEE